MQTLVVNTFGGPSSGKSTLAYGLMAKLKCEGHNAELVVEYAKELTYRRDFDALKNQFEVVREQDRRLRDLVGQVDIIVNDSPLLLGICYAIPPYDQPWNVQRTWELFNSYNNFNIFVRRVNPYQTSGRKESEDRSKEIDAQIAALFDSEMDLRLDADESAVDRAYQAVLKVLT